jgi:hypothetical protein
MVPARTLARILDFARLEGLHQEEQGDAARDISSARKLGLGTGCHARATPSTVVKTVELAQSPFREVGLRRLRLVPVV